MKLEKTSDKNKTSLNPKLALKPSLASVAVGSVFG